MAFISLFSDSVCVNVNVEHLQPKKVAMATAGAANTGEESANEMPNGALHAEKLQM